MAEKRMFAKTIIDSDAFLDMPLTTQALYFHLSMRADDDGFINNAKKIQRYIGASDDDLRLLAAKRFIIPFQSGVVVIKHWKIHNYIQSDRYKPTVYEEEKAALDVKPNKAYTLKDEMYTECIQDASGLEPQIRLDKNRLDKNSGVTNVTPRRTDERQIVTDAWNEAGISPIRNIMPDTKRDRMLAARIREYGLDEVLNAIGKVKESAFLKGHNDKGWVVTFDWFLLPNNFQKVLEGNYADTKRQSKLGGYQRHGEAPSAEMQAAIDRMLAEQEDEG